MLLNYDSTEIKLQKVKNFLTGDLDNFGVSEDIVEQVKVGAQQERVDDVVLASRRQLHEAREAEERAVAVMLQVDRHVTTRLQLGTHQPQLGLCPHHHQLRVVQ